MSAFKEPIETAVRDLASSIARERGLCVLRVVVRGTEQNPVIELVLDGPRQVLIEDCEVISRHVNEALESTKAVKGNLRLDVMSPGLDEPLKESFQFERSIGRLMEVQWEHDGEARMTTGYLRGLDKTLTLEVQKPKSREHSTVSIPREQVKSARLLVDFKSR